MHCIHCHLIGGAGLPSRDCANLLLPPQDPTVRPTSFFPSLYIHPRLKTTPPPVWSSNAVLASAVRCEAQHLFEFFVPSQPLRSLVLAFFPYSQARRLLCSFIFIRLRYSRSGIHLYKKYILDHVLARVPSRSISSPNTQPRSYSRVFYSFRLRAWRINTITTC